MAGTMQGKVWLFSFNEQRAEVLCAFSEEGVRGLHLDDDTAYATLTEGVKSWWRGSPFTSMGMLCFKSLDKKNPQNVKHVMQRGPHACVLFPALTLTVNAVTQEHQQRQFKLFDLGNAGDVAPCDFDGEQLLVTDRTDAFSPVFRVIQLEKDDQMELPSLPRVASVSCIKLWGDSYVAYGCGGNVLYVWDFRCCSMRHELKGHRAEIGAIDATNPYRLTSLSLDATVKVWNGRSGECTHTLFVPEASFFLGFPYSVSVVGRRALVSADDGVFLMEFDGDPPSTPLTL